MKFLGEIVSLYSLFHQFGVVTAASFSTGNECGDTNTIANVDQCKLCTKHENGQNSSIPEDCFVKGVFHRFFQCHTDDCKFIMNIVPISPNYKEKLNQTAEAWECYFDITTDLKQGDLDIEHRARFYVHKYSGCSNSTIFSVRNDSLPGIEINIELHPNATQGKNKYFTIYNNMNRVQQ